MAAAGTEQAVQHPESSGEALLEVRDLVKHFPITQGIILQRRIGAVKAVDGVSFSVRPGETLGIVGETGCGKSTTARLLVRLLDPTSGSVLLEGEDIARRTGAGLKALHREMQMIFQDPYSSLNPRKTVGSIIAEPYAIHGLLTGSGERKKQVQDLMDRVGLNPEHYNRYPHEFSGGQRQRIGVARAVALEPKLLIADEPVSALDVSIQAQVLNLLKRLQREMGLTLVFISHDLSVVRHMCDRIAVMYLGKLVELAPNQQLYSFPRHPYTGALLSAVPVPEPAGGKRQRQLLTGDVPSPANPPPACRFHTRCPKMQEICRTEEPLLEDKGRSTQAACHFPLTQDEVKSQLPKALATSTDGTSPAAPIGIPSAPIRATRPARRATPGEEVRRDLPLDDLLRRRAWAGWIDVLLLVILAVVIAFTVGNSHIGSWTTVNSGVVTKHSGVSFNLSGTAFLVWAGISLLYYFVAELLTGQTIGKRIMGLKVATTTGQPLGAWPVLVRTIGRVIDVLPAFYLVGWIAMRGSRPPQRLGDRLAQTTVDPASKA